MVESIKDLEKLFKLCRKQGITDFKFNGIEVKFGDLPNEHRLGHYATDEAITENPYANFPDGELSPEQLAFYSSGGLPEDDPFLKEKTS